MLNLKISNSTKTSAAVVLAACVLLNLSIQFLYTWSLIRVELLHQWDWTPAEAGLPFTLILVFFAVGALVGGRLQDKFGPRWIAAVGGLMAGSGLIFSGLAGDSPLGVALAFGALSGLGIGCAYGSALPAALKWFHPSKKGLIGGIVLGGFSLASVMYAPITGWLLNNVTIESTFLYLGAGVVIFSFLVAQFVKNPPENYVAPKPKNLAHAAITKDSLDFNFRQMLKTPVFYLMFATFALTSSVGLMMIGNISNITNLQLAEAEHATVIGIGIAVFLISFAAIINTAGRIAGGSLSDRIGRTNTLLIAIVVQMINMLLFSFYDSVILLTIGFALVGLCLGIFLTMFPTLTGDQFGLKNYGLNYGIMYMACGVAGLLAPVIADRLYAVHGNFFITYIVSALMMLVAMGLTLFLKKALARRNGELNDGE
ncbi:MAG: OFA family MFS transporter [Coriobacteriia bacterium]|nr:OFA family MFS transporter [Coriobacteriia bacterium]